MWNTLPTKDSSFLPELTQKTTTRLRIHTDKKDHRILQTFGVLIMFIKMQRAGGMHSPNYFYIRTLNEMT